MTKAATWLAHNGANAATIVGLVSGIPFGVGAWAWGALCVAVAALLLIAQAVLRRRVARRASLRLERILEPIRQAVNVESALGQVAESAGLMPPWRVTLYCVTGDSWERLSRVSNYPRYASSGRAQFPVGEGVVTWALRAGGTDELPSLPDPQTDFDDYLRVQSGRALSRQTVEHMNMKSRAYAAIAIHVLETGASGQYVALVAESEQQGGANLTRLERAVTRPLLVSLMRMARSSTALDAAADELSAAVNPD